MEFIFVQPGFSPELYFCEHNGEGFRLSNQLKDALVMPDPQQADEVAEQLKQQSGLVVRVKKIMLSLYI